MSFSERSSDAIATQWKSEHMNARPLASFERNHSSNQSFEIADSFFPVPLSEVNGGEKKRVRNAPFRITSRPADICQSTSSVPTSKPHTPILDKTKLAGKVTTNLGMQGLSCPIVLWLLSLQFRPAISEDSQRHESVFSNHDGSEVQDEVTGTLTEDLVAASELGIPSNESRRLGSEGVAGRMKPSILTHFAYPLAYLGKYKAKALREVLMLPYRALTIPVELVKALSETIDAIRRPFDAKKWLRVNLVLTRTNMTTTTDKPPERPTPTPWTRRGRGPS